MHKQRRRQSAQAEPSSASEQGAYFSSAGVSGLWRQARCRQRRMGLRDKTVLSSSRDKTVLSEEDKTVLSTRQDVWPRLSP